ncbi:outer membrane beta-barrel protein [Parapedobacter pyrenivorans]|uniref:outer membrane beta-barrel protein n=1 Tax=Parapedobacter pyrenivorans TaxID=1305674 RepID=UPI00334074D7
MRNPFKNLSYLIFFFLPQCMMAQQPIRGKIVDSVDYAGLFGANLRLLAAKDSLIDQRSTSTDGQFQMKQVPPGKYRLQINYLGYRPAYVHIEVPADSAIGSLTIPLLPEYRALEEVAIIAAPPAAVLKGDTTEFDAAAFSTEPYADADALVMQIPGVEIDEDGQVKAQGEDVQRIIVDGKEFFSTDPRIALKTLPADIISKIQLIDEQSEQAQFTGFDDGQRRKVINIVTRPDRRKGYFGRAAGGYGASERYNTGGNLNSFDGDRRLTIFAVSNNVNQSGFSMANIAGGEQEGGRNNRGGRNRSNASGAGGGSGTNNTKSVSTNFNDEWLNERLDINANYAFNSTNNETNSLTSREYLIGANANQFNTQNQESGSINYSHRANIRVRFDIDSNQRIDFRPTLSFQQNNRNTFSNNSTMLANNDPVNASARNNDNENSNFNLSGSIDYNLRLGKPGRTVSLSANGSVNSNKGLARTYSLNEFFRNQTLDRVDTVSNRSFTAGYGNGIKGRMAYTEPLGRHSRLQANYSLRNTANYSNRETFEFLAETGQLGELNRQLSNEFRNDYTYHSGGLSYQIAKRDSFRFEVGMDFQEARLHNNRTFPDATAMGSRFSSYLPSAEFSYNFSQDKKFDIGYRTATKAPAINELQDVINNQNPLNIRTGNAHLKQEYGHRFTLRFNRVNRESGSNFAVNVGAELANDRIVTSTLIAGADTLIAPGILLGAGGQFTRPVNIDGYYSLSANTTYGTPVKPLKININLSTNIYHNHDVGLTNRRETYSNSYGVNQRVGVNSRFGPRLVVGLSYTGNYSIVQNNSNTNLNYNAYNQIIRNDVAYTFWKGIRIASSLYYNYNQGLADGYNQQFALWNASIGKKLLRREEAEITLSAYDLLNRNTNINRSISERYIQDTQNNALQRYFLLSFTYNLRKFGGGRPPSGGRRF